MSTVNWKSHAGTLPNGLQVGVGQTTFAHGKWWHRQVGTGLVYTAAPLFAHPISEGTKRKGGEYGFGATESGGGGLSDGNTNDPPGVIVNEGGGGITEAPGQGGGGGGGGGGAITPAPSPAIASTTAPFNWKPWAIGGAAILGLGTIAYAFMSSHRPRRAHAHENPLPRRRRRRRRSRR